MSSVDTSSPDIVARSADPAAGRATPRALTKRRLLGETAGALVISLGVAIVLTWPLLIHLGHVAHDGYDPRFQAWTIDWVQYRLFHPGSLFDANIFAPNHQTLAYSDSLLGIAIPQLPLRWLGVSPIGQLNIALLLGMSTSAASGYLFGRLASRSVVVGAFAGAAFAFGPFGSVSSGALHATAHAGVGVAAAAAWWLADRADVLDAADPRAWRRLVAPAALLVAALAWQSSVSFYPGVAAFCVAGVVLLCRARSLGRRGWLAALAALGVGGVCTLLLAIPYLQVQSDMPGFQRTLAELVGLNAKYGKSDPRLSIWGSILGYPTVHDGWPIHGEPAWPGLVVLLLAPVGAVTGWRAGGRLRRTAIVGGAITALGVLLASGAAPSGIGAYSPYRLLFDYVPGVSALRATGRAWSVGMLGLGVLAGLGALAILRAVGTASARRRAVGIGLVVVLVGAFLVEGYAPWTGLPDVRVPAVDQKLADIKTPGGVLYLPMLYQDPIGEAFSGFRQAENVYATTAHHRPTPNGYSGYSPPSFKRLSREMRELPSESTLATLRRLGIKFVVVRSWAAGNVWAPLLDPANAGALQYRGTYDGDVLYEVPPAP
jgi:hypothetical protein